MENEAKNYFIKAEAESRDTIDVKRVYVVMCGGNFADAVMLSQIVYWNLPDKDGRSKLRVKKDGKEWIAKTNKDWYDEIAMTEQVAGRARRRLVKLGFIESKVYRFSGLATSHIRIRWDNFIKAHDAVAEEMYRTSDPIISKSDNRSYQKAITECDNLIRPLTESTSKTTTNSDVVVNSEEELSALIMLASKTPGIRNPKGWAITMQRKGITPEQVVKDKTNRKSGKKVLDPDSIEARERYDTSWIPE